MEASSLLSSNINQELINTVLHKMLFTAYATVIGISKTDPLAVLVQGCVCNRGMPFTTKARLVYPTTAFVQVSFRPMIGDKVLVVGLQSYSDLMFESSLTLTENEVNNVQHYTILGCVAIPLNIESVKAPIKISNDATSITLGRGAVPGEDPVVRWSELNTALQGLMTVLMAHKHSGGTASGGLTGTVTPDTPITIDITAAASDILKVPAAGE